MLRFADSAHSVEDEEIPRSQSMECSLNFRTRNKVRVRSVGPWEGKHRMCA
jgi:hypothetical protein